MPKDALIEREGDFDSEHKPGISPPLDLSSDEGKRRTLDETAAAVRKASALPLQQSTKWQTGRPPKPTKRDFAISEMANMLDDLPDRRKRRRVKEMLAHICQLTRVAPLQRMEHT